MRIWYSDTFELPLPENHRFPMAKYRLLRERVAGAAVEHGFRLLIPEAASDQQLLRVHHADYLSRVVQGELSSLEVRRIGFPWSPAMVERSRRSVGASIAASRAALQDGVAVNLAGGTHHAFPDAGQGYCVFNDVAVAARDLQSRGLARRILFVDLDVHQGNGTAAIAAPDSGLFAFSIHCEENFPFRKTPGDLDISLPAGAGDEAYLQALDSGLEQIRQRFDPDVVFYLAGADPFAGDRLGRLELGKPGLVRRDEQVLQFCAALSVPCVVVMAGGYAPDIADIVDIHFHTVLAAARFRRDGPCTGQSRLTR